MKILFAIKSMNNPGGGAERVLAFLCNTLAARGHNVSLLTFDNSEGKSFYSLDSAVQRIYLGIGNPAKKTTLKEFLSRVFSLRKCLSQNNPDVAVAFLHSMYFPLALSVLGTGRKVIASEHTAFSYFKSRKLQCSLLAISALMVQNITVLSGRVRDEYPLFMRRRMIVMPNPVSTPQYRANVRGDKDLIKIILSVGRLDADKDHKILIDAFSKISDRYPQWRLRLIGEGPLRTMLEMRIKQQDLIQKVDLPGAISDIGQEYLNSHIFVLPSIYEGFGLATAEAMSYGLPVIGFADCAGTNELIVDGENGILVQNRSSADLALALEKLMVAEDLRVQYGNAGIASLTQYDPDLVADSWENLLMAVGLTLKGNP